MAQLVARKAGGLEVVGSSPATLIFFVDADDMVGSMIEP